MIQQTTPFAPGSTVSDVDLNCLSAPCEEFVDVTFERVDLCGAHFEQASFERCRFSDVLLTKALINGARFTDCSFHNCRFFRADIVGVRIIRCRFENCDFSWATLADGCFEDVQFIGCATNGSAICDNEEKRVAWHPFSECEDMMGGTMLDHDAIAARHSELLTRMMGEVRTSDAYRTFDGDEGSLLLIDEDGYYWAYYERGQDNGRGQRTRDVEELLYWFLLQTAVSIAHAYEFANRVEGPDFRRVVFAKELELLGRAGPEWRARREAEIAAMLAEDPWRDQ